MQWDFMRKSVSKAFSNLKAYIAKKVISKSVPKSLGFDAQNTYLDVFSFG